MNINYLVCYIHLKSLSFLRCEWVCVRVVFFSSLFVYPLCSVHTDKNSKIALYNVLFFLSKQELKQKLKFASLYFPNIHTLTIVLHKHLCLYNLSINIVNFMYFRCEIMTKLIVALHSTSSANECTRKCLMSWSYAAKQHHHNK